MGSTEWHRHSTPQTQAPPVGALESMVKLPSVEGAELCSGEGIRWSTDITQVATIQLLTVNTVCIETLIEQQNTCKLSTESPSGGYTHTHTSMATSLSHNVILPKGKGIFRPLPVMHSMTFVIGVMSLPICSMCLHHTPDVILLSLHDNKGAHRTSPFMVGSCA